MSVSMSSVYEQTEALKQIDIVLASKESSPQEIAV